MCIRDSSEDLISKEFAEDLKQSVSWEVVDPEKNAFKGISKERFQKMLMTTIPLELRAAPNTEEEEVEPEDIPVRRGVAPLPRQFSWMDDFPECIHDGREQGSECGGCWAFGIANHLSDRFCIWGKDVVLSVQDLLECDRRSQCCSGGVDTNAYQHMMEVGLVEERCRPYDEQCGMCRSTNCQRFRCKKNSVWFSSGREKAKREIYYNGPIQAVFDVYSDFINYNSGVYYHMKGENLGIHTVEVLGWGVESGMNYWLCKNSWGGDWGMNGFFKIKMGEAAVERYISSCIPDV
eukprot:TRINITY_DN10000_c0_g1_i11.p1 TRINITY_DN10000_c0_g1~~TRINITY_DN10000_c0_g1_i11.p1  ORF type:complete len:292 (+),score=82.51 TRINITY_DN10000_c0_g1_i11:76-951(+)